MSARSCRSRLITWGSPALGLIAGARLCSGPGDARRAGFTGLGGPPAGALYGGRLMDWPGRPSGALFRASAAGSTPDAPQRSRVDPRIPRGPGDRPPGATGGTAPLDRCRRRRRPQPHRPAEGTVRGGRPTVDPGGDWSRGPVAARCFSRDHPDDSRIPSLYEELQAAQDARRRDDHLAQLDAARKVNDPERVLDLHQEMIPLLEAEARASLEADLSQWFLKLIHKRLRTGKIQTDVALLAGRIADSFSHTVEGASLRASLPTLRRSAGLCPRCAQPYTGVADACPSCLQGDGLQPRFSQTDNEAPG